MTPALQALYDYTLENRFSALLTDQTYKNLESLFQQHLDTLYRELPQSQRETLEKLCDALWEQRDLELEALFQAAWAVSRELS